MSALFGAILAVGDTFTLMTNSGPVCCAPYFGLGLGRGDGVTNGLLNVPDRQKAAIFEDSSWVSFSEKDLELGLQTS